MTPEDGSFKTGDGSLEVSRQKTGRDVGILVGILASAESNWPMGDSRCEINDPTNIASTKAILERKIGPFIPQPVYPYVQIVLCRRGRLAAVFTHYSDAVIFIDEDHGRHGYERHDEPGLDELLKEWLQRPRVDGDKE